MNDLRDGLEMTFQALHEGIVERDTAMLSSICETNLRQSLTEFFEMCDEEDVQVESNSDGDSVGDKNDIKLTIIDYQQVFGSMLINRNECHSMGLYEFGFAMPPNTQLLLAQMNSLATMNELRAHL